MPVTQRTRQEGFALFVIAGLFLAFALVAAASIDRSTTTKQLGLEKLTQDRLQRITYALIEFSLANSGRFPCPSDPVLFVADANFGKNVAHCEAATDSMPNNGDSDDYRNTGISVMMGDAVVRGAIPLRALIPYGIKPADVFDAWGNRIAYHVDRELTANGTGVRNTGSGMDVTENISGSAFRQPVILVASFGRDGIGAIAKNQSSATIPCNGNDGEDIRLENCNEGRHFILAPINAGPTATASDYFDDLLSFY